MLHTPWTAHKTNMSILDELRIVDRLSTICRRRILTYFAHISRREHDNLERLIVQGKVEGKKSRNRAPLRWADQIKRIKRRPHQRILIETEDWQRWIKLHGHDVTTFQS